MPYDMNTRGISAVTAFVLFLGLLTIAFINSTYQGAFGSIPINVAVAIIALAFFIKLASALGVNNRLVNGFDRVLSIVPLLIVVVFAYQALNYYKNGPDGFMASLAIAGLVGAVIFGLMDTIVSWTGDKYRVALVAAHEINERAAAVQRAASGSR